MSQKSKIFVLSG